jgi:hypothetical protein
MVAYLILSLLTGVLSSLVAAILGAGGWSIAICYIAGSWIGFLVPLLCALLQRDDRREDYLDARSGLLAKRATSDA